MNGIIAASRRRDPCSGFTQWNGTKDNTTHANACGDGVYNIIRFHGGANVDPRNGDIIYNALGCTVFDGQDKYYSEEVADWSFQINSSGVVSNRNPCI